MSDFAYTLSCVTFVLLIVVLGLSYYTGYLNSPIVLLGAIAAELILAWCMILFMTSTSRNAPKKSSKYIATSAHHKNKEYARLSRELRRAYSTQRKGDKK